MQTEERTSNALTVAVAQFLAGTDVEKNLRRVEELTAQAAARGAQLVVFPEASMYSWEASAEDLAEAAHSSGPAFLEGVSAAAVRHGVTVVVGTFEPRPDAQPYNRLVVVAPDGSVRGCYDKVHLYDAFSWQESDKISAGTTYPDGSELCTLPVGGFTIGLLNCYDLRFPEMARALAERGADVIVVSSAWVAGPYKEMHWETLLRSRAIENTSYVVASDQPPPASVGLSMIIDPFGLVVATCPTSEGLALHELDPAHLREVRQTVPSLSNRRYRVVAADHDSTPHASESHSTDDSEGIR
ncbi:MAG: carbon-nitrogen hydrolase family protein [Geodermatophilaceae bacterium]